MGKKGLRQVAELCFHKSHYAAEEIGKLEGFVVNPSAQTFFKEFMVRLPVLLASTKTIVPHPKTSEPRVLAPCRVLVVDDNADSARTMASILRLDGHVTDVAFDGPSAVEAARNFLPDVVLLDIGLPTMNGYDTCRTIREQPSGQSIVMIALTGWGQDDDRVKSREAGFDAHFVKPINHDELTDFIAKALSERHAPVLAGISL
jgi:CheY-like chemotaxis protein